MNKHNLILWLKVYISFFGKFFSYVVPPILSLAIFSIMRFFLTPNYWLYLAIVLTVPVGFLIIKINQMFIQYSIITDTIVDVLKKDMEKHSEGLSERHARTFPDTPMVNLKNYISAITSIRTNGYIEFTCCQNMGLDIKNKKELMLHEVTPGMHQYFMVLRADEDPTKGGYIRIYAPDESGVSNRDFTETWFNHIFPILGSMSNSVSEKLSNHFIDAASGEELSEGYFIIKFIKIFKKGKNREVSFRIYL